MQRPRLSTPHLTVLLELRTPGYALLIEATVEVLDGRALGGLGSTGPAKAAARPLGRSARVDLKHRRIAEPWGAGLAILRRHLAAHRIHTLAINLDGRVLPPVGCLDVAHRIDALAVRIRRFKVKVRAG